VGGECVPDVNDSFVHIIRLTTVHAAGEEFCWKLKEEERGGRVFNSSIRWQFAISLSLSLSQMFLFKVMILCNTRSM